MFIPKVKGEIRFFSHIIFSQEFPRVALTNLGRSFLYKRLYNIGLNTVFASILPIISLLYLNVATVRGGVRFKSALAVICDMPKYAEWV